jgi:SP family arabinose:H+ symporter-like MFS transporter
MYIAEIAPTRMRGRLVTLYQLGIVLGILSAVFVNMLIQRGGTEEWNQMLGWKWMFMAGAAPAVLFALVISAALESPRWLMKVGRLDEGLEVLTQINGEVIARAESVCIRESLVAEEGKFSEMFTSGFGRALFLGVVLAGLTQTSGITPVFSYLPNIFEAAGTKTCDAFFQSVLVSLINLVFTLIALSVATTSLWIFAFLGNLVFPVMQKAIGNHGAFWVFAFMALVNVLFVLFMVPETKGHSLEEIEKIFVDKNGVR